MLAFPLFFDFVYDIKQIFFPFQGLIKSKQKQEFESPDLSSPIQETVKASDPVEQEGENLLKRDEACPICQEILRNQKMVFQCGHSTCCNCNYFDLLIVCLSASNYKHFSFCFVNVLYNI